MFDKEEEETYPFNDNNNEDYKNEDKNTEKGNFPNFPQETPTDLPQENLPAASTTIILLFNLLEDTEPDLSYILSY